MVSLPSTPIDLQETSLLNIAQKAQQLLRCCQEFHDEELRRAARVQLSRFDLWTSNIGVFSSRHSSLDYRLRTAPTARIAVEGNIEILCTNLLCALKGCSDLSDAELDAFAEMSLWNIFDYGIELIHDPTFDKDSSLNALSLAEGTISTLHRLSLAIRKASNRNSLARVPKLLDVDGSYTVIKELQESHSIFGDTVEPTVFEATTGFEEFVRRVLQARWYISEPKTVLDSHQNDYRQLLLQRCVVAITTRRRQLAYFQNHQIRLAMQHPNKTSPVPQNPNNTKASDPATPPPANQISTPTDLRRDQDPQGARSETIPSEFQMDIFKPPPSTAPSSNASVSESGSLGPVGPFEVPPAPELGPEEKERACPYCCLVYPAKTFSPQKKSRLWKKHVCEDLQPYICLFKNCDQAGRTHRSFKEWQAHLSTAHYQSWVCPLPHSDVGSVRC